MAASSTVQRRAFAKLNLALSVGPPRPAAPGVPAGMHPIISWMHCIDLADDVIVERLAEGLPSRYEVSWAADERAGDSVSSGLVDWPIEADLAARAHKLLERETGRRLPAAISVRKRIPAGAGLGGGSSDAAATLLGVNQIFGLALSVLRLAELSRELGSDVAFFVDDAEPAPRPAIVSGFGEVVQHMARCGDAIVLIVPPVSCVTGAVYKCYDELGPRALRPAEVRALASRRLWPGAPLFNDLAAAAERVEPKLAEIRRGCEAASHRPIHITGSGSAMFAIAGSVIEAAETASRIAAKLPQVAARVARLL